MNTLFSVSEMSSADLVVGFGSRDANVGCRKKKVSSMILNRFTDSKNRFLYMLITVCQRKDVYTDCVMVCVSLALSAMLCFKSISFRFTCVTTVILCWALSAAKAWVST